MASVKTQQKPVYSDSTLNDNVDDAFQSTPQFLRIYFSDDEGKAIAVQSVGRTIYGMFKSDPNIHAT